MSSNFFRRVRSWPRPIVIAVAVIAGLLCYVDTRRTPNVNRFVTHRRATATGLRNRPGERLSGEFPAELDLEGDSLGAGKLQLRIEAEPLAVEPQFHLSLKLNPVNLRALNQSLCAYTHVDVAREGGFGDAMIGLFATATNLFHHGFICAFNPTVEGSVPAGNGLPSGKSADGSKVGKIAPAKNPPKKPTAGWTPMNGLVPQST